LNNHAKLRGFDPIDLLPIGSPHPSLKKYEKIYSNEVVRECVASRVKENKKTNYHRLFLSHLPFAISTCHNSIKNVIIFFVSFNALRPFSLFFSSLREVQSKKILDIDN